MGVCALAAAAVLLIDAAPGDAGTAVVIFASLGFAAGLVLPSPAATLAPVGAAIVAGVIDASSNKPSIGFTAPMVVAIWIAIALPGAGCALVARAVRRAARTHPESKE